MGPSARGSDPWIELQSLRAERDIIDLHHSPATVAEELDLPIEVVEKVIHDATEEHSPDRPGYVSLKNAFEIAIYEATRPSWNGGIGMPPGL